MGFSIRALWLIRPTSYQRNVAGCDESLRFNIGIVVGGRTYVPNWGYDIFEYVRKEDVNELIPNE